MRNDDYNGDDDDPGDEDKDFDNSEFPLNQRLAALEDYVFVRYGKALFTCQMQIRSLESKLQTLLAHDSVAGPKALRYNMSTPSSPEATAGHAGTTSQGLPGW